MVWTGNSNPVPSVLQSVITSDAYSIASTSTTVTLLAASSTIIIQGDPSVSTYVNFRNTTATNTNFLIPAGGSLQYQGAPLIEFTMISATGTATVQIIAY